MLELGDLLRHRRRGWRLAVLHRLSRGAPGRLGDLALGVFFVRLRDCADRVALEVDPRRPGPERLQISQGASVRFQCARDQARPKLRVLGDDVVVDADLERLTRLAKAVRKELGELGKALVHAKSPSRNTLKPRSLTWKRSSPGLAQVSLRRHGGGPWNETWKTVGRGPWATPDPDAQSGAGKVARPVV
jgi:hypothetical protein